MRLLHTAATLSLLDEAAVDGCRTQNPHAAELACALSSPHSRDPTAPLAVLYPWSDPRLTGAAAAPAVTAAAAGSAQLCTAAPDLGVPWQALQHCARAFEKQAGKSADLLTCAACGVR